MRAGNAFTLIELSIVLVIIGLIVGGVLVGRDLISAAGVRAQISQIDKYQTAANTFRQKYGFLPGDIPNPDASRFGFAARGTSPAQGDGDGLITGYYPAYALALFQDAGETPMFWMDLAQAHLVDGGFTSASATSFTATNISATMLPRFIPEAKLGRGNFVFVGPMALLSGSTWSNSAYNYFTVTKLAQIQNGGLGVDNDTSPGLTVKEAYAIDSKIDDGLPQSGIVVAAYAGWWASPFNVHLSPSNFPGGYTTSTAGSSTTCYDNGSSSGIQQYSIAQGNGAYTNCGLSIKFQ